MARFLFVMEIPIQGQLPRTFPVPANTCAGRSPLMQFLLDDADMGGMLATWYMRLHSGAAVVPTSLYALLHTTRSCRNSNFVRLVLQHTKNCNVMTHNTKNAALVASMYLNLALSNAQYRRDYYRAMLVFFGMFPEFTPLMSSETQHWRGILRHVNSLVTRSGILNVLAGGGDGGGGGFGGFGGGFGGGGGGIVKPRMETVQSYMSPTESNKIASCQIHYVTRDKLDDLGLVELARLSP